jgi:hypothetical protein
VQSEAPSEASVGQRLSVDRGILFRRASYGVHELFEATSVDFDYSAHVKDLQARLTAFMDAHVYPNEQRFGEQVGQGDRWQPIPLIEELKAKARAEGHWYLFLPASEYGAGRSNRE